MPQIDITLKSTADIGGFTKTADASQRLNASLSGLSRSMNDFFGKLDRKFSGGEVLMDVLRGAGLGSGWQIVAKVIDQVEAHYRRIEEAQRITTQNAERHATAMERIAALGRTQGQADFAARSDLKEAERALKSYKDMLDKLAQVRGNTTLEPEEAKRLGELEAAADAARVKVAELDKAIRDKYAAEISASGKAADAAKTEAERVAFANLLRQTEAEARRMELQGEKDLAETLNIRVARMKAAAELGLNTDADMRRRAQVEQEIRNAERAGQTELATAKRAELAALRQVAAEKERSLQATMRTFLTEAAGADEKARREKTAADSKATFAKVEDSIQRDLNRLKADQAAVEADATLADMERRTRLLPMLEAEIQLLRDRARLKTEQRDASNNPVEVQQLQAEIERLNAEVSRLQLRANDTPATKLKGSRNALEELGDPSKHYQTMDAGVQGGFFEWFARVGTMADQVAESINTVLGGAVSGITNGIMGWINGATTFGGMIRNIGQTILQTMLQTIIQMGVQWLVNQALIRTGIISTEALGDTLRTARVAKENAAELATLPAKKAGAAASGISSFGTTLIFGALALALIATAASGFAEGGVVRGPGTSTSDSILARLSNGESVLTARTTSFLGEDFINQLNADPVRAIARPYRAGESAGAAAGGEAGGRRATMWIVVNDLQEAQRLQRRNPDYETHIVDIIRRNRGEIIEG